MIGSIAATRVYRDWPDRPAGALLPGNRPIAEHAGAGGSFHRDPYRKYLVEISLHDFGLEESYGRFVSEKVYARRSDAVCGGLIDLYV